jgi:hypothetical protein
VLRHERRLVRVASGRPALGAHVRQGHAGVKVVILPNRDFAEGDPVNSHTYTLFFQDGSSTQPRPIEHAPVAGPRERTRKVDRGPSGGPMDNDPMPF